MFRNLKSAAGTRCAQKAPCNLGYNQKTNRNSPSIFWRLKGTQREAFSNPPHTINRGAALGTFFMECYISFGPEPGRQQWKLLSAVIGTYQMCLKMLFWKVFREKRYKLLVSCSTFHWKKDCRKPCGFHQVIWNKLTRLSSQDGAMCLLKEAEGNKSIRRKDRGFQEMHSCSPFYRHLFLYGGKW